MKVHHSGKVACIILCFMAGLAPCVGQFIATAAPDVGETTTTATTTANVTCEYDEFQYRDGACMELFEAYKQNAMPKFNISGDNGTALLKFDLPNLSDSFFENVRPSWSAGACREKFALSHNILTASLTAAQLGDECGMDCMRPGTSSSSQNASSSSSFPSSPLLLQNAKGKRLEARRNGTGEVKEETISCHGNIDLHLLDGKTPARIWTWSNVTITFAGKRVDVVMPSSPSSNYSETLDQKVIVAAVTIAPRGVLKLFTEGFAEPLRPGTILTDLTYLYVDLSFRADFYHNGTAVWVEYQLTTAQLLEAYQEDGQSLHSECGGTFQQDLQITHQRPDMVNHRVRFRLQASTCRNCTLCVQAMVRKYDGWRYLKAATHVDILQTDQSTIPSTWQFLHTIVTIAGIAVCAMSSCGCYCVSRQYRKNPPIALFPVEHAGDITSRVAEPVGRGRGRAAADPKASACEAEDIASRVAEAIGRGRGRGTADPNANPCDAEDIASRVAEAVGRGRGRAAADPEANACEAEDVASRVAKAIGRGRGTAAGPDPNANACEAEDIASQVAKAIGRGSGRAVVEAKADTNTVSATEVVAEIRIDDDISPETCRKSNIAKEMHFKIGGALKPVSIDTDAQSNSSSPEPTAISAATAKYRDSIDTGEQSSVSSHEPIPIPGIAAKCGAIWSRIDKGTQSSIDTDAQSNSSSPEPIAISAAAAKYRDSIDTGVQSSVASHESIPIPGIAAKCGAIWSRIDKGTGSSI